MQLRNMLAISFLLIMYSNNLFSQEVEISGGPNYNMFYDLEGGHFFAEYKDKYGFTLGAGVGDFKLDKLNVKFLIQYDHYQGDFRVSDGGLGYSIGTIATIKKSILSFGIFPLNFDFFKNFNVSGGILGSMLIAETFSGQKYHSSILSPTDWYDLKDLYEKYNSLYYFGLQGRVSYDFKVSERFSVFPMYIMTLGLTSDFQKFPIETKSLRHHTCIGVKYKLF